MDATARSRYPAYIHEHVAKVDFAFDRRHETRCPLRRDATVGGAPDLRPSPAPVDCSAALGGRPVGVVIGFDSDEEAVQLANDSKFGLSGSVHSADTGRAYEIARRLRMGGVAINGGAGVMLSAAPFGGIKRSGFGREFGLEGLNEFTYTKTVSFRAG